MGAFFFAMEINYIAFFLIAFVPLILGHFWYDPERSSINKVGISGIENFSILKKLFFFLASLSIVYVYMNLVIHQLGFYELFFTDIMKGSESAQQIVDEFMALYGGKHRHLGHGLIHGAMYGVMLWVPVIGSYCILTNKSWLHFKVHFIYAMGTTVIVSGLIAAFV